MQASQQELVPSARRQAHRRRVRLQPYAVPTVRGLVGAAVAADAEDPPPVVLPLLRAHRAEEPPSHVGGRAKAAR